MVPLDSPRPTVVLTSYTADEEGDTHPRDGLVKLDSRSRPTDSMIT